MGWWGTDVFGGDEPLDILGEIESALMVADLYPLARWDDDLRAVVKERLTFERIEEWMATKPKWGSQEVMIQVVASVAMAAGVPLTNTQKADAKKAALEDQEVWREEHDPERQQAMATFVAAIEAYDGTPVVLSHKGLFQTIAEHVDAGQPGPVNINTGGSL